MIFHRYMIFTWAQLKITGLWFGGISGAKLSSKFCNFNHRSRSGLNSLSAGLGTASPIPEFSPFAINFKIMKRKRYWKYLMEENKHYDFVSKSNRDMNTWTTLFITRNCSVGTTNTWLSPVFCFLFNFSNTVSSSSSTCLSALSPRTPRSPTTINCGQNNSLQKESFIPMLFWGRNPQI